MADWEELDRNRKTGSDRPLSLLRAFGIGAAMALGWGMLSHILGLENLFSNAAQVQMFSLPLPIQLILYVAVSPVAEEFLFRRLLFDLMCRIMRRKTAAVIVSVLFALWHGNVIQMLYAFPAGLILQHLRERSGRVAEPVICHMGANLTAILVQAVIGGQLFR